MILYKYSFRYAKQDYIYSGCEKKNKIVKQAGNIKQQIQNKGYYWEENDSQITSILSVMFYFLSSVVIIWVLIRFIPILRVIYCYISSIPPNENILYKRSIVNYNNPNNEI